MKFMLSLLFLVSTSSLFAEEGMSYIEYSLRKEEQSKFKNLENYKKNTKKKKANEAVVSTQNGRVTQEVSTQKSGRTRIFQTIQQPTLKKIGTDLNLNYYTQFLGPSLGGDYQSGATYNRFNSGQDYKGDSNDPTGSYQVFHAITIGYQLSLNSKIFYSYSFQDNINKGIEYTVQNENGTESTYYRNKGPSDNNKRMGVNFFNVINNDYVSLSLTPFYEFPSTYGSETSDMNFGLGLIPSLSIKSNIIGLSYGVGAEIQRNFYDRNQHNDCETCNYPTRFQTLVVNVTPYLNYQISDLSTFKTSLQFDWDQQGDEVNSTEKFNKNLDDTIKYGFGFNMGSGIATGFYLESALEKASLARTALGLYAGFNLF